MPETGPQEPPKESGGGGGGSGYVAPREYDTGTGGTTGGTSGSTSGGSSGGGGGGGGGGTSEAEARARRNNANFFRNTIQELGIGLTGNLGALISNAVANEWSSGTFLFYLRKTKEYRKRFAGIFAKNGSLKMSESQYIATEKQYHDVASRAGISLGPKQIDWMFKNNVSPSEFGDRALAYTRLNRNNQLYRAFRQELAQSGEKPGQLTRKNMLRFVLGEGNKSWYDLWNDAVARNAAQQAGLAVGRKNAVDNLSQGLLERISSLGLSESSLAKGFEQLGDDIAEILPLSQLYKSGISKRDLVTLRFGGKGRNEIAERVKEIIAQRNLSNEGLAQPQLQRRQGGGTGVETGGLSGEEGY